MSRKFFLRQSSNTYVGTDPIKKAAAKITADIITEGTKGQNINQAKDALRKLIEPALAEDLAPAKVEANDAPFVKVWTSSMPGGLTPADHIKMDI